MYSTCQVPRIAKYMVPVMPANSRLCLQLESFGLIGMQLPEKFKENFNVLSEGPFITKLFQAKALRREVSWRRAFARNVQVLISLYFSGSCIAIFTGRSPPPLWYVVPFGTAIAPHTYFFQKARFYSKCNWES